MEMGGVIFITAICSPVAQHLLSMEGGDRDCCCLPLGGGGLICLHLSRMKLILPTQCSLVFSSPTLGRTRRRLRLCRSSILVYVDVELGRLLPPSDLGLAVMVGLLICRLGIARDEHSLFTGYRSLLFILTHLNPSISS